MQFTKFDLDYFRGQSYREPRDGEWVGLSSPSGESHVSIFDAGMDSFRCDSKNTVINGVSDYWLMPQELLPRAKYLPELFKWGRESVRRVEGLDLPASGKPLAVPSWDAYHSDSRYVGKYSFGDDWPIYLSVRAMDHKDGRQWLVERGRTLQSQLGYDLRPDLVSVRKVVLPADQWQEYDFMSMWTRSTMLEPVFEGLR